jgi:cell division protein FtsI/penicillin-binding protein 2
MKRTICICLLAIILGLSLPAMAGAAQGMNKTSLARLLQGKIAELINAGSLRAASGQGQLTVENSLWQPLQRQAEYMLSKSQSLRAALVLLEADTGRVLVLAGSKGSSLEPQVALDPDPPAASLFKVVTAAAAVEETSLTPISPLNFVGRPHTLYNNQIAPDNHPHGAEVSLRQSFADSNNPIFAKLGIHILGKDLLAWYGRAFGFESQIPFELPMNASTLYNANNKFSLGEMACGYNRDTTISPLHAALLAAVCINGGRLMEPYIIKQVITDDNQLVYKGAPRSLGRIISPSTASHMQNMFAATIKEGTAKNYFRDVESDKFLRNVMLGGKTGTISRTQRGEHYEWFIGYARDPNSGRSLAIASLVVHGKTRGGSAKYLARVLLHQAFSDIPARMASKPPAPSS